MNLTINEAIDKAVAKMRPIRRAVMQRRLQNTDYREQVADELLLKLWADKGCCTLVPELGIAKGSDSFTATTTFAVDPENLEKFLQIILTYLPQILELILRFLPLLMSLLTFVTLALSMSMASAQQYGYVASDAGSGGCTGTVKSNYGCTGSAVKAASGYGSTGSAAVQSYGCTGSAVKSSANYGCTGSAVAPASYGSSGSSAVKDRRPLRSILENKPVRSRIKATLEGAPVRTRLSAIGSVVANAPARLGSAYEVALASAQYRAANRIRGHAYDIEAGYTTGVGFHTDNENPRTCYGVGGNYVSVRGPDGWYSTKVL
jgi:hypothetical protein